MLLPKMFVQALAKRLRPRSRNRAMFALLRLLVRFTYAAQQRVAADGARSLIHQTRLPFAPPLNPVRSAAINYSLCYDVTP